jgi:hypothetical protein
MDSNRSIETLTPLSLTAAESRELDARLQKRQVKEFMNVRLV